MDYIFLLVFHSDLHSERQPIRISILLAIRMVSLCRLKAHFEDGMISTQLSKNKMAKLLFNGGGNFFPRNCVHDIVLDGQEG